MYPLRIAGTCSLFYSLSLSVALLSFSCSLSPRCAGSRKKITAQQKDSIKQTLSLRDENIRLQEENRFLLQEIATIKVHFVTCTRTVSVSVAVGRTDPGSLPPSSRLYPESGGDNQSVAPPPPPPCAIRSPRMPRTQRLAHFRTYPRVCAESPGPLRLGQHRFLCRRVPLIASSSPPRPFHHHR